MTCAQSKAGKMAGWASRISFGARVREKLAPLIAGGQGIHCLVSWAGRWRRPWQDSISPSILPLQPATKKRGPLRLGRCCGGIKQCVLVSVWLDKHQWLRFNITDSMRSYRSFISATYNTVWNIILRGYFRAHLHFMQNCDTGIYANKRQIP